jgi:imidazolonepropionase
MTSAANRAASDPRLTSGLLVDVHIATQLDGAAARVRDAALAWRDGRIVWLGPRAELPSELGKLPLQSGAGGWVTPGLIDCHTHVVHAGNRAAEFAARLAGASYADIAARGGGIASTVRATRAASVEQLVAESLPRIDALLAEGVTTLEIKSGYGLLLESERAMLRAARRIADLRPVRVRTTFLGAHALPSEYDGRADDFIDYLACDVLPALHAERLVDAVDAYCEHLAFSPSQVARLFDAARALGLPVKLHAEHLSNQHGAALAARYQALSADHLEWLDDDGVTAMARAGTVAVLLPGAFHYLRETRVPPVASLRSAGVPMAVATDCNPGTSPLTSMLTALNLACVAFRLTTDEALAGATRHAARALALPAGHGTVVAGSAADLNLWQVSDPAELCYAMGLHRPIRTWLDGIART